MMAGSSYRGEPSSKSSIKMAGALVLSVFCHEVPGAVSTVQTSEGFVTRLTDGSGMDSCLPEESVTKNLSSSKEYR